MIFALFIALVCCQILYITPDARTEKNLLMVRHQYEHVWRRFRETHEMLNDTIVYGIQFDILARSVQVVLEQTTERLEESVCYADLFLSFACMQIRYHSNLGLCSFHLSDCEDWIVLDTYEKALKNGLINKYYWTDWMSFD